MTFTQLVQNINRTEAAIYTDFIFEDGFFLCAPIGITRRTARSRYKSTKGRKAPKISKMYYSEVE